MKLNNKGITVMLKSILAATFAASLFASGAIAATPTAKIHSIAKPATTLVQKASMKKCAKGMMMMKGKCAMDKMHMMKKK
jgi:hypothetical protein